MIRDDDQSEAGRSLVSHPKGEGMSYISGSPSNMTSLASTSRDLLKEADQSIQLGRFIFICCLLVAAVVLATLSFYILRDSEERLADFHYDSIAGEALAEAAEIMLARRWATIAMSSILAELLPNATAYPFVAMPGYERISNDILNTTTTTTTTTDRSAVALFVTPEQLPEWEKFAYDFFYNGREPETFPESTGTSLFGQGVWSLDQKTGQRIQDLGECRFDSCAYDFLAPIFQSSRGPDSILMYNVYGDAIRGLAVEHMIRCVQEKTNNGEFNTSGIVHPYSYQDEADLACGVMMPMSNQNNLHIGSGENRWGPASEIFQPVRPVNDRTTVTGVVMGITFWGTLLEKIFDENVQSLDCVVSNEWEAYTYTVSKGQVTTQKRGDFHDPVFDHKKRTVRLVSDDLFYKESPGYNLTIYPTVKFYDSYETRNPRVALIGTLCIMLFTSLFFFFYDACVRRDLVAKKHLLRAKRRFMRYVSHEVRTPLNAVCMGLDLIGSETRSLAEYLKTQKGEDPIALERADECVALVEEIKASAQSAVDVLNDILNYDKIEKKEVLLEIAIIPVWDLLARVVNEFRLPAANKKLHLELEVEGMNASSDVENGVRSVGSLPETIRDLSVVGDIVRLKQVLRNLISNAIKFTPEGGSVRVNATASKKTQGIAVWESVELQSGEKATVRLFGKLHLKIADTGAGMNREQLRKLFGEGVQFNANELQKGGGSGLGLWISKGIVERHKGSLAAKSAGLGKGSTFDLHLPLYQRKENQSIDSTFGSQKGPNSNFEDDGSTATRSNDVNRGSSKLHLLIVDDVSSNRKLLRRLLEMKGYLCDDAENGQIAVVKIEEAIRLKKPYDSILMDYEMPVMDGPTATQQIRAKGFDVFIVGVTGNMLDEDVEYFRSCGANAVTGKPIKLETLEDLWVEYGILSGHGEDGEDEKIAENTHVTTQVETPAAFLPGPSEANQAKNTWMHV